MRNLLFLLSRLPRTLVIGLLLGITLPSLTSAQEKPKVAFVDIQLLFRDYHKTISAENQINQERARIQKDNLKTIQTLQKASEHLQILRQKLMEMDPDDPEREEHIALFKKRSIQVRQLNQERTRRNKQKTQSLNQKMAQRADAILAELHEKTKLLSKKLGYDLVFDQSGLNSSQVFFILYAKDATDITPQLSKLLNP